MKIQKKWLMMLMAVVLLFGSTRVFLANNDYDDYYGYQEYNYDSRYSNDYGVPVNLDITPATLQFAPVSGGTSPAAVTSLGLTYNSSSRYINAQAYLSGYYRAYGFIYSTNNDPMLGSGSSFSVNNSNGYTDGMTISGSFYAPSNVTYYVKAYVIDGDGNTKYSSVQPYTPGGNWTGGGGGTGGRTPSVRTISIDNIRDRGADIRIRVSDNGSSHVTERGVVYSSARSNPTRNNGSFKSVGGTTGDVTVFLDNLSYNTKYYVRAYAKNAHGESYGETMSFTTGYGSGNYYYDRYIRTETVKDVMDTTAVVTGYAERDTYGYRIRERGFVYSSNHRTPTLSNGEVIYDTDSSTGRYSRTLTGLNRGTTYYVRAYIKTSNETRYGNILSFTTKSSGNNTINISYVDPSGAGVGNQTLTYSNGQILNASVLSIPSGYVLQNSGWTYTVNGNADITLNVMRSAYGEGAFMPGNGSNMFYPDAAITRGEVAQIMYNLDRAKGVYAAGTPRYFSDTQWTTYKAAIDHVTSKGYMSGYPQGIFRPESPITRAEMAVVLCNYYKLNGYADCGFYDINRGYWAYNFIALATQAGMISGYTDNTYQPNRNTTRAETCVLFSLAERRSLTPLGTAQFSDVPASHWAYQHIMNAAVPSSY